VKRIITRSVVLHFGGSRPVKTMKKKNEAEE
jgi:hypothetical protein